MAVIAVGVFRCNCVVVACEITREAIVIDPGDEPERVVDIIDANDLHVTTVVHTHAHLDHVMGANTVVERTGAKARLHAYDRHLWNRVGSIAATYCIPPPAMPRLADPLQDGERIRFGRECMQVIHTPGHTAGSCCFAVDLADGATLFTGDTLLPNRSHKWSAADGSEGHLPDRMVASTRGRLLMFDDETRIFPGHGAETRMGIERRDNPMLSGSA